MPTLSLQGINSEVFAEAQQIRMDETIAALHRWSMRDMQQKGEALTVARWPQPHTAQPASQARHVVGPTNEAGAHCTGVAPRLIVGDCVAVQGTRQRRRCSSRRRGRVLARAGWLHPAAGGQGSPPPCTPIALAASVQARCRQNDPSGEGMAGLKKEALSKSDTVKQPQRCSRPDEGRPCASGGRWSGGTRASGHGRAARSPIDPGTLLARLVARMQTLLRAAQPELERECGTVVDGLVAAVAGSMLYEVAAVGVGQKRQAEALAPWELDRQPQLLALLQRLSNHASSSGSTIGGAPLTPPSIKQLLQRLCCSAITTEQQQPYLPILQQLLQLCTAVQVGFVAA